MLRERRNHLRHDEHRARLLCLTSKDYEIQGNGMAVRSKSHMAQQM